MGGLLVAHDAAGVSGTRLMKPGATAAEPQADLSFQRRRRRTREMRAVTVVESPKLVVPPPAEWAQVAHRLVDLVHASPAVPSWWTTNPVFHGGVETRTEQASYCLGSWDPSAPDGDVFHFQLGLAGCGEFQLSGEEPQKITAGQALFTTAPSRHRYSMPSESPGWTFAWLSVRHPYLADRVAQQVAANGPLMTLRPDDGFLASALRLLRGSIRRDFRDRFEAEIALFEFVLAFERWNQHARDHVSEGERLMDRVRSLILSRLPKTIAVNSLAAEFGMSRCHFSHFFREQTGLTPAHFATDVRIQEATRMLTDTREPLKTIADACGFANANHFCKVFRRLRHLSPSAFRQVSR
jgi:AraC-like DNA-binding protein